MKKVYVAPVMECEEFIANEYVASCWIVKCKDTLNLGHGSILVYEQPTATDSDDDGFYFVPVLGWYYRGDMNKHSGSIIPHPVDITLVKDGEAAEVDQNHPNASN